MCQSVLFFEVDRRSALKRKRTFSGYQVTAMNQWIRASIFCGAVPLATGIGIFLLWWLLRWEIFMFDEMLTVLVDIAVFVIGLGCLATYVWDVSRSKRMIDHRTLLKSLAAGGILAISLHVRWPSS